MTDSDSEPGRGSGYHPESFAAPAPLALVLAGLAPPALFAIAAVLLVLASLCALFEAALQHYSRVRLMAEARRLGREEEMERTLRQEDEILFASKIGRSLLQVSGVALLVVGAVEAAPPIPVAVGWTIGVALAFLLFNVAVPFVIGRRAGHRILLRALHPYGRALLFLRPVSDLLARITGRLLGAAQPDPTEEIKDEILSAVEEGASEGSIEDAERRMIEGVIDMREVTADHIMTPRTEMVALALRTSVTDAVERAKELGLSRLPVFRETPDTIIGVLYMKDLLPYIGTQAPPPIGGLLRQPFFIPETKPVGDLLQEMRARQVHLAIVLDEYGGTAGLVSIEDILEEIVGEIADEHESAAADVLKLSDNAATVEGRTHIDDLNREMDVEVPESEEYETVGGLLLNELGRVPHTGEECDVNGVRFTILDADERRVHRVKVTVKRDS